MTVVRFKNLNVGRSRPSNKFQTHSIGNENLGQKTDAAEVRQAGMTSLSHAAMGKTRGNLLIRA